MHNLSHLKQTLKKDVINTLYLKHFIKIELEQNLQAVLRKKIGACATTFISPNGKVTQQNIMRFKPRAQNNAQKSNLGSYGNRAKIFTGKDIAYWWIIKNWIIFMLSSSVI